MPYDQEIANQATAVEQCMKLGAVILKPKDKATGFAPPARIISEGSEPYRIDHG